MPHLGRIKCCYQIVEEQKSTVIKRGWVSQAAQHRWRPRVVSEVRGRGGREGERESRAELGCYRDLRISQPNW
ncbi:hypothetical protein E2C01_067410 [Portunus trituberculatus]|uniref:Uncharacterized protein n=1 Tax=Portunus trituberculatus TaxID=210409 RepID=A0A5B7HP17_PORTR|nr:hypothetical protein [Portunus trituberculatus]